MGLAQPFCSSSTASTILTLGAFFVILWNSVVSAGTLDISQRRSNEVTRDEVREGIVWTNTYRPLPGVVINAVVDREDFIWATSHSNELLMKLKVIYYRQVPRFAMIETNTYSIKREYYFRHRRDGDEYGRDRLDGSGSKRNSHQGSSLGTELTPKWTKIQKKEYYNVLGHLTFRGFDISAPIHDPEIIVQRYQPFGAPTQAFMPGSSTTIKYVIDGLDTLWQATEEEDHCVLVIVHGNLEGDNVDSDAGTSKARGGRKRGISKREGPYYKRTAKSSSKRKHSGKTVASETNRSSHREYDEPSTSSGLRGDELTSTKISKVMKNEKIARINHRNSQGMHSIYLEKIDNKWIRIDQERFYNRMEEIDLEWDEYMSETK